MAREEFKRWIKAHARHLLDSEPWEIARLALAVGFEMADIAPDISEWVSQSRRKLLLWDNPLFSRWVELWAYQRSGREWDIDGEEWFPNRP